MNTQDVIDACILGVGDEIASPTAFTRVQVLAFINQIYRNEIGKRVKSLASFVYDGSDSAHTITAGVGTLPSDFLLPAQVYDGDAPDQEPLEQIFEIADKVANDADCSQYMIPDTQNIWFFGQTSARTIKLYYYKRPAALTDSNTSIPVDLKEEFHRDIFVARVKEVYAENSNNTYDMMDQRAKIEDLLNNIGRAHTAEKRDETLQNIRVVY